MPTPPPLALLLAAFAAACAPLRGRPPRDATPDASPEDAADAPEEDAPVDLPVFRSDAPRCPGGATPALDPDYTYIVGSADAGLPFYGAQPRAAFRDGAGRVYVAGYCGGCAAGDGARAALWRFDGDTASPDLTWGERSLAVEGTTPTHAEFWVAGALDPMNRVVVVGNHRATGGGPAVARFTARGQPDATFGDAGSVYIPTARISRAPVGVYPYAVLAEAASTLVTGSDAPAYERLPLRAMAFRLDAAGGFDATFGDGGVRVEEGLRGCFDVKRDGDHYVLACMSREGLRPVLLRLDARGERSRWPAADAASEHTLAPRGFHPRALLRDSAGRWLVGGAVSVVYTDVSSPPAAVRYLPDGRPDPSYGVRGVATLPGTRQTFAYTFSSPWAVTCEDRLVFGASVGITPALAIFDADGALLEGDAPYGIHRLVRRNGATGLVSAVIPTSPSSAIAFVGYNPSQFGFFRLLQ